MKHKKNKNFNVAWTIFIVIETLLCIGLFIFGFAILSSSIPILIRAILSIVSIIASMAFMIITIEIIEEEKENKK